jgi:hypothetical protein
LPGASPPRVLTTHTPGQPQASTRRPTTGPTTGAAPIITARARTGRCRYANRRRTRGRRASSS